MYVQHEQAQVQYNISMSNQVGDGYESNENGVVRIS